ncbi:hypothetical protein F5887DRAFT_970314 [Amanita rubescens]|nr:hypothetical protein F5887DRAFT_970314 [Amanita rubescens]
MRGVHQLRGCIYFSPLPSTVFINKARDHALSSYTPICRTCGFILCSMNHPQYACPFCSGAILSPQEKSSLVASLEKQIQDILDREEREREKEVQDAKKAAGEFPTLLHSMKGGQSLPKEKEAQHKVLSVKSMTTKGGASKVVVSSRSYSSTPVGSRPASRGPDANKEEEPGEQTRVPRPGREPKHADRVVGPDRPWENLLDKSVTYVPEVSKA